MLINFSIAIKYNESSNRKEDLDCPLKDDRCLLMVLMGYHSIPDGAGMGNAIMMPKPLGSDLPPHSPDSHFLS
jgi:hypothetical protein